MSFKIKFVVFVAVVLCYNYIQPIQAVQVEELKAKFIKYMQCIARHPVTEEELTQLSKKELPTSENAKCLLACSYKKWGLMDQHGKLAVEEIKKESARTFAGNPEKIKKSEEFINSCKYVNDAYITGDKKECQRAVLIFNCSIHYPYE